MKTALTRLSEWYSDQCDGDWEHSSGIDIQTIDNPGFRITINLADTALEGIAFPKIEEEYETSDRWFRCWVEKSKFEAVGAPGRLEDMIETFLYWAGDKYRK